MSATAVHCPSCRQKILKATPNAENKIRCGACGESFVCPPPSPETAGPQADELVLQPHDSGMEAAPVAAAAKPELPPLGREPASASYGLLAGLGWAVAAYALIAGGESISQSLQRMIDSRSRSSLSSSIDYSSLLLESLGFIEYSLLGVLIVYVAGCLARIDRRASWMAWRSAALTRPMREPPGSSLPFILPFCVSGGVWVIISMGLASQAQTGRESMTGGVFYNSGLLAAGLGVLVFLIGLGCGELRRFFWRVEQFGRLLPDRKRGGELSIGEPRRTYAAPSFNSSNKMLLVTVLACLVYGVIFWNMYEPRSAFSGGRRFSDRSDESFDLRFFSEAFAFFLFCVGGCYTIYRLSRLWNAMLSAWERARASIGCATEPVFGAGAAARYSALASVIAWIVLVSMALLGLAAMAEGLRFIPGFAYVVWIAIMFLLPYAMWWLAHTKQDSTAFVRATAVAPQGEPNASSSNFPVALLTKCVFIIVAVQVVWVLWSIYNVIFGRMSFSGMPWQAQVGAVLTSALSVAGIALPAVGFALVAKDLNRVAENLEGCAEVS
jgi:hypothetical protein